MVRTITRRQQVSAIALCAVLAASPVFAQDVTVSNDRTTTLTTSQENVGNGNTLTVNGDGSVVVGSGTAIVVDGNHNLTLQNSSTITTNDIAAGRGILVNTANGNIQSNLIFGGTVNTAVQTAANFNVGNTTTVAGLLVSSGQGLTGNITTQSTAVFNVHGSGGRGIAIDSALTGNFSHSGDINVIGTNTIGIDFNAPVTGNVLVDGSVNVDNAGTVGVRIGNRINGNFTFAGTITTGRRATASVTAAPAKAAVLVENSVTGGILLQGIGQNNDANNDGTPDIRRESVITSTGGGPALLVDSTSAGNTITLGEVGSTGYSLVHKGNIRVLGTSTGNAATGLQFQGTANAPVTLQRGIWFDTGTLTAISRDNTATGVVIGSNVTVPTFLNQGTIDIDTTASSTTTNGNTVRGPGGVATGILIQENGSLASFENRNTFSINSQGASQNVYGVRDLSGTLRSFTNSGNFNVATGGAGGTAGSAIALDARANTSGITVNNSGTLTGNILLGSGNDTVTLTGGNLTGNINFGAGNNTLNIRNNAVFRGASSSSGQLNLDVNNANIEIGAANRLEFTNASFSGTSNLNFIVNPEANQNGQLIVTNTLNASSSVNIVPIITRLTREVRSFDLIRANNINLANASASLALSKTPYLFDISLSQRNTANGSIITLNARPKAASELGLNTAATNLYNNLVTSGLNLDNVLESSLSSLTTKAATETAVNSLLPDITGGSRYLAEASVRQLSNHLSNRLQDFVHSKTFNSGGWAREVTTIGKRKSRIRQFDADILTVGLTFGYDAAINENFVLGVNAGFTLNGLTADRNKDLRRETSTFAPFTSVYAMARAGDFYIGTQVTAQFVAIKRERNFDFGTVDRLVRSNNSAWNFISSSEAGYNLKIGQLNLAPFARLTAQRYSEGGYTETGGDTANLTVSSSAYTRVDGIFGASLGYDFKWETARETRIVRPEVFYSYSQKLSGPDADNLQAIFVGGDRSFLTELDRTAKSVQQLGGAFSIFGLDSTARVHYAYEKLDQQRAHSVNFNFGLAF